jgi:hypothetical protein
VPDHENEDKAFGVADLIYRPVIAGPDPIDVFLELLCLSGRTRIRGEEIDVVRDSPLVGLRQLRKRFGRLPPNLYPIGLVS